MLWLTWGGGANGQTGKSILTGAQSTASVNVGGQDLQVTCTMGDISHDNRGEKDLVSYAPGDWSADYMDDWYNIGGTGKNNRLIAGLMRKSGQASFNISCAATLGGELYRIRGLVVADAESMNTTNEIIEASALGHWNVVEMNKVANGNYTMKRSTDRSSGRQTVSFGPGTDSGAAATMFLSFNESAFDLRNGAAVDMRFRIVGGGNTAIAIGLLVPMADYGDAPASYGEAVNLIDDMRFANDSTNGADGTFNLNASSFRVGGMAPPVNHYLGAVGPGLPVRLDFGVRMPDGQLRGQRREEAVLGSMLFAPGSAQIAAHYQPQFAQMVQRLEQMGGGELVIRADGEQQALALARAQAVHQALLAALPATSHARYSVRVEAQIVAGKALMAAIDGAGVRVGSVLFDTDRSGIRPEFMPVLDALAELIASRGGGRVAVIGHTDLRLSHAYNTALGLRRARAVHQALSERLPASLQQQMRVQVEQDASAPVAVQE